MGNNHDNKQEELGYLFNVEILVRNPSNAKALQDLLSVLNSAENIIDYRINSGIELGTIIESLLENKKQTILSNSYKKLPASNLKKPTESPAPPSKLTKEQLAISKEKFGEITNSNDFDKWIKKLISENKLIRLVYDKNGQRVSIPCRILNFIPESYAINVYHVDEKQVYTFSLSQIIDFIER